MHSIPCTPPPPAYGPDVLVIIMYQMEDDIILSSDHCVPLMFFRSTCCTLQPYNTRILVRDVHQTE